MSTKIYNGYKLPVMSLMEIQEWIRPLRKKVREDVETLYSRLLILHAIDVFDNATVLSEEAFLKEVKREKMTEFMTPLTLSSQKISEEVDSPFRTGLNLDISIVFIGIEDATLVLFYHGDLPKTTLSFFEEMPHVESYYYFDNSDEGEEEFGKAEWDKRKENWDKAFQDSYKPSEAGFTISLNNGLPFGVDIEERFKHISIPSLEKRARSLAKKELEREKSREIAEEFAGRSYSMLREYSHYLESSEGQEALAGKVSKFEGLLEQDLDFKTLHTRIDSLFKEKDEQTP
ncbi:hypothetical protein [Rossellomorea marisflavi]|uniref:hypothetical protein n=1 Tax=Rossellomorea marisflavi TaxID=189381 RepID=UPI003F9F0BBF